MTNVISQQESKQQGILLEGGVQKKNFSFKADDYEANKHFFLAHYFRDNYDDNLLTFPSLTTPFNITRLEVWVTNRQFQTVNIREVIGITDLGETDPTNINQPGLVTPTPGATLPENTANSLYNTLVSGGPAIRQTETAPAFMMTQGFNELEDYEIITARKLEPSEYFFQRDLGFISLNRSLAPDEVMGIAMEYTDLNGNVRQIGEFAENLGLTNTQDDQMLILKLLKPKAPLTSVPTWDLMMKNVYSLGAFQVDKQDFRLDIFYADPGEGQKRYLPVAAGQTLFEVPMIRATGLDRYDASNFARPDGVFDFIPGYTINQQNGRLYFPVVEPFGADLEQLLTPADADIYVYDEIYDLTKSEAQQFPEFNRFSIVGTYKSKITDEISLGAFGIPQGSLTVTGGGRRLIENVDYTVDYNLGKLKILNAALVQSGSPINVKYENNLQFGFDSKRLLGSRLDYYINDNFNLGGTLMQLREKPFSNKVNLGDDPISNTVMGLDLNFQSESPWLTRLVDNIPGIDTKQESSIAVTAEVARFIPGHAKQIGKQDAGQVYIDDFEGASSSYDLKFPSQDWTLASTPRRFPESVDLNMLTYGYNRAKLSWYNIDPSLNSRDRSQNTPSNLDNTDKSDLYGRQVFEREIFPNVVNERRTDLPLTMFDVSYYPEERGPYNFDDTRLNPDGSLQNPDDRWGGIMRSLLVTDFQAANIEFIEFWLMDPFLGDHSTSDPGKLYLNLGNISEDILRDGRKFFENGLPEPNQVPNLDNTAWGRVPNVLNINNTFSSDPGALTAQDVGFDGLNNADEATFFAPFLNNLQTNYGAGSGAYTNALLDPSADDYHHFYGADYDAEDRGIVDRYKNYSLPQGNSSGTSITNSNTTSNATNVPDTEDLNRDNTLERTESYYEYEIDLDPMSLQVGQNFIVSEVDTLVNLLDGSQEQVKWYQFKVPVKEFTSAVGGIQGFQSMRFIRMYMTEFDDPVTLRFARFDLIRNQWRRYASELDDRLMPIDPNVNFNVFPVNIEENANKQPIPYVLPPGIQREEIQGAANSFLRNEQSLAMSACALPDGDGRAIYKLLNLDLRNYEELKMFVHAEEMDEGFLTRDDELEFFVRVGSDFSENYYEKSIPLKMTPWGTGSPFEIWPQENDININLKDWVSLKLERNATSGAPTNIPFFNADGDLSVLGTPDMGFASFVMLGVRNPLKKLGDPNDDGLPKCAEIWVNELRVSGFNEENGYAALARADFQMADFGNISVSGNMHTVGYGNIEQRIDSRFRDDYTQFDVSGNFELDKFIPSKAGVRIPVYAGYSRTESTPQYDPYELDVELKNASPEAQDAARDLIEVKTLNFTNVRKERTNSERTPKIYDVSNFNLSYSFTEKTTQNPIIFDELDRSHFGAIGYNYSPTPLYIQPFNKLVKKGKYLQWLKDININPIPSNLSFRTDMTKRFQETYLRDIQDPETSLDPFYYKDWLWNRDYDLRWNLTKSIALDYNAKNVSRIDEPDGIIDTQNERDSIWNNVKSFGRNATFNQTANATYSLPFDKIPILDWVQGTASYGSQYQWTTGSLQRDFLTGEITPNRFGNVVQNSRNITFNADLNFSDLYNKSGFLKQYNEKKRPRRRNDRQQKKEEEVKDEKKTPEVKPERKKGEPPAYSPGLAVLMKPLLSVKRFNINYSKRQGTTLPGFQHTPEYLGQDFGNSAPGFDFIFGRQPDRAWLDDAAAKGWITEENDFSYQFIQDDTKIISASATLEPAPDLNVEVNLDYQKTNNYNELFRNDGAITPDFIHVNPFNSGSYNVSFISFKTLFDDIGTDDIPLTFREFEARRIEASEVFANRNPNSVGVFPGDPNYRQGYGPYSQEVITAAFISAYTGKSIESIELNPFDTKPLPNWRVSYNGLTKVPFIGNKFTSIRLNHAYQSSFAINSFNSNLNYVNAIIPENYDYFLPSSLDVLSDNYYSLYFIPQITITESFAPLAGIDLAMKNGLTTRLDYRKSRTLGMSLIDYQLSESSTEEFVVGAGFRTKNFKLPFRLFGKSRVLENDLIFRMDYSFRDDIVTNYKLDQNTVQPTRGARTTSILPTVDYVINDRMNLQLYFDRRKSIPKTRNSYPISNTKGGMKLTYSFSR